MRYQGTFGIQYAIHFPVWRDLKTPDLLRLAETTAAGDLQYLWFDDGLDARHTLCAMAAMAARVPFGYGTLVTFPWAENPLDIAAALGTIAELLPPNRELMLGISTGGTAGRYVERIKPVRMVRETIDFCRQILAGEEVALADYPGLVSYFHLKETATVRFPFDLAGRVSFWIPPGGPMMLKATAELADGIALGGGTRLGVAAMTDGTLDRDLEEAERLRRKAGNPRPLRRLLNLEMSLGRDRKEALWRANMHAMTASKRSQSYAARLLQKPGQAEPAFSEEDLEAMFLVGTPDEVGERLLESMEVAERLGCEHILLGVPAGPRPLETAELAGQVLVPMARQRMAERT